MDSFVQQMVPMRVAMHLAEKQSRALRAGGIMAAGGPSSAAVGVCVIVQGLLAAGAEP
jgi:hypothetical protein